MNAIFSVAKNGALKAQLQCENGKFFLHPFHHMTTKKPMQSNSMVCLQVSDPVMLVGWVVVGDSTGTIAAGHSRYISAANSDAAHFQFR